jgi:hypothetical protein
MRNCHSILSKSTSFVGADARSGAEGLDCLKVLNEYELFSHSCGGKSQRKGYCSKESFRYVGDNDTNHEHDRLDNFVTDNDGHDQESHTKEDGDGRDDDNESVDLNGKWGLFGFSLGSKVGNRTNESSVTSPDANTTTGSFSALGTEEAGILGLEDGMCCWNLGSHEDLNGLTSEGSIVDLHLVGFEDNKIARDVLTTFDLDDVAGAHFSGSDSSLLATSDDVAHWRNEVLELGHHFGGLGSLLIGENSGNEHDGSEYNTKIEVGPISLIFLDNIGDDTEDCTGLEEEGEETSELVQEEAVPWDLLLLGELVVSVTLLEIFRAF